MQRVSTQVRQFWTTVVRKNKKGERRNNDSKRRYAGADQKDDACPFLHQRIAGAYFDEEGYVDGTFNTNFLRLSLSERTKQLALAKTVPFSDTNVQLKDYKISREARRPGSIWQLLDGILQSEMKNDGLLDLFYEVLGETYQPGAPYAFFLFYGRYDVPAKAEDKARLEDSEELYEYLIGTISPLAGEYEPGKAELDFSIRHSGTEDQKKSM